VTQRDWMRRRNSWHFDGLDSRPATTLLPIAAEINPLLVDQHSSLEAAFTRPVWASKKCEDS
jgi:hypothetical protein